jgi:hypothetical protein
MQRLRSILITSVAVAVIGFSVAPTAAATAHGARHASTAAPTAVSGDVLTAASWADVASGADRNRRKAAVGPQQQTMATRTSAMGTVRYSPSIPPWPCTRANDGEIAEDPPGSGVQFQCICKVYKDLSGFYCNWYPYPPLELPPPRKMWINYNTWLYGQDVMYLDVSNVSQDNGAAIHQWTYTGAANQWWDTSSFGNAFFQIVSVNSGKCLGVGGGSTGQGAGLVQWDCLGTDHPDQYWAYVPTGLDANGNPVYEIVNMGSGMCLGIAGGSLDVGAPAVQWACNGNPDQRWL